MKLLNILEALKHNEGFQAVKLKKEGSGKDITGTFFFASGWTINLQGKHVLMSIHFIQQVPLRNGKGMRFHDNVFPIQ